MRTVNKIAILLMICAVMLFAFAACNANDDIVNTTDETENTTLPEETEDVNSATDPQQTTTDEATEPQSATEPKEVTEPSSNTEPENEPSESEATAPESEPSLTEPEEAPTETTPDAPTPNADAAAYLAYYEMSAAEQQAFIDSFGSYDAFFAWHTAAKAAYEAERTPIDGSPLNP